jgi:protein-disulfide isomerase
VLPKLKDEYIDKGLVRFIHKDLPLPFHQNAHLAATSARCALEDGKYWEAYQALFSQQNCLDCQGPVAIIASTGISRTRLDACNRNKKIPKAVNINISEAELNGIRATPTFVLGHSSGFLQSGRIIEGAIPWSELRPMINKALEESRADRAKRLDPDLKN